jgi:hypothetical protein
MEDPEALLLWDRGNLEVQCERSQQVREGVEAHLGRTVFAAGVDAGVDADAGAQLKVRVRLSRSSAEGGNVVAVVSQEDETGKSWGERVVTGDGGCESLDEPLTLVVALMVDGLATESKPTARLDPEPAREPAAPSPSAEEAASVIHTTPTFDHAPPAPGHFAVLVAALAAMGASPEVGFGGGVSLLWKPRGFWGVGLDVAGLAPQSLSLHSGSLQVSSQSLDFNLCPLQDTDDTVWWNLCGGAGVVRLQVRSRDLLLAKATSQYVAMPGLRARAARVIAGRWLLGGGLAIGFPISPDRYVYRDEQGNERGAFALGFPIATATAFAGTLFR